MSLLTIAIPTFNRSKYLKQCLESLYLNKIDYDKIEIVVLDNNSDDDTFTTVNSFSEKLNIKYIKNNTNIGPDENFKKCIKVASTKYVWIFGDDDIFFSNTIESILKILDEHRDVGVIHLKAVNFTNNNSIKNEKSKNLEYQLIKEKNEFVKYIHTNITFITANIVNKELILKNTDLSEIPNNNLGQVYWTLVSVLHLDNNIIVHSKLIGARQYNSGNYNFCEVFGNNFMETLYLLSKKYDMKSIIKIFKKRLLTVYFPANIVRLRNSLSNVKYDNCFKIFFKKYKYDIYFWLFTLPSMILPKKIALFIYNIAEYFKNKRDNK